MTLYNVIKYLHILAVAITVGGMFARQVIRGLAARSANIDAVATFTHAALPHRPAAGHPLEHGHPRGGRHPGPLLKWPILGFLQGASQNWLLVSNLLLVVMLALIPVFFVPHNKKVEALIQTAVNENRLTAELEAALKDSTNAFAHYAEEAIILIIALLMVLKPF